MNNSERELTEDDDFHDVYRELARLKAHYYKLGIHLGLKASELDAISLAYVQNLDQALTQMLLIWLRKLYDVSKFGSPTWKRLVEAVKEIDPALAKTIALNHAIATECNQFPQHQLTFRRQGIFTRLACCCGVTSTQDNEPDEISWSPFETFHEKLAAFYLRRVDDRAWPPVSVTNFVDLALMKDNISWRITLTHSIDSIVTDQNSISYAALSGDFEGRRRARRDRNDMKNLNLILLEGRTGCGKTTFMIKISRDWANGEILQEKLLLFVKLGRLETSLDLTLTNIIQCACPSFDNKDISSLYEIISEREGVNTVFAFDGLDEYSTIENNLITNIIKGEIFPNALVIVTSRPASSQKFRRYASKKVEVLGFLQHNVKEYIRSYFAETPDKADDLINHLDGRANLMNMCYLPLHAAMLAFLYKTDECLPETETEIYAHFTLSILLRSIQRRHGTCGAEFHMQSHKELVGKDKDLFQNICKLAFKAAINSLQTFKHADIKDIGIDVDSTGNDESTLGLIVVDRYFMKYGYDATYTFLHQTFQEYLAAVHMSESDESELMALINQHSENNNLLIVWRFLCGMMDFSKPVTIKLFEHLIEKVSSDSLTNVRFAHESQHALPCTSVMKMYQGTLKFSSKHLSPLDCTSIGYVISKSEFKPIQLIFKHCDFTKIGLQTLFLRIGNCPITLNVQKGKALISLIEGLRTCSTDCLVHLRLAGNKLGDIIGLAPKGGLVLRESLREGLKNCKNLQKVDLSDNNIEGSKAKYRIEGLQYCSELKDLNIRANNLGDLGTRALIHGLQKCKLLQTLNLSLNNMGDTRIHAIFEDLKYCINLRAINIGHNNIGDKRLESLAIGLCNSTNLQYLDLCDNNIGPGAVGLSTVFESCTNLEEINLAHNNLDDRTMAMISGLKRCTKLKKLNLWHNNLGNAGVAELGRGLEYCNTLEWLDLSENNIETSGVSSLVYGLKHCTNFQELSLSFNNIDEAAANFLVEGFVHWTKLRKLDLDVNKIKDTGSQTIADGILKHCKHLEELSLCHNSLSDGCVKHLRRLMFVQNLQKLRLQENNFTHKKGKELLMEGVKERDEYHLSYIELTLDI